MQLEKAIKERRSVRKYSDKKPDWRKIIKAIDSARFAPYAGNLISNRFILVSDENKIKEIRDACQQDFVGSAQYIVVVVSNPAQVTRMYEDKAEAFLRQQSGAAIQNFLLTLTELGLSTCWVGWFDSNGIKRTLKIPDDSFVEGVFPIGFETKIKTKKPHKTELDNLVFYDSYGNKFMEPKTKVSVDAS